MHALASKELSEKQLSHVAVENMKSCFFHHLDRCCWGGQAMLDQLVAGNVRKAETGVIVREVGKVTRR